jgi:hypothetical protein
MNVLREIWQDFPPWLKTFLLGLVVAIATPTLTALQSIDTATDWRVWLGALTAAVGLSVAHYLKDRLRITLAEALAGGGLLVASAAFGAGYLAGPAVQQAGGSPPLVDSGDTINVPASPGNTTALKVCKDGIVSKGAGQVHIEGTSEMQDGYAAVLGPERMTYTDYPKGGKNLVVILNGQPQTVQVEVVKCLLSRGK